MHKVEIPRKVLQRRAFTPFAQYSPQKDKAGLLETDSIQAAFKKGEEHRDHLRHNRQVSLEEGFIEDISLYWWCLVSCKVVH